MDTSNWKWFRYEELFVIKKGKRLTKADMIAGTIPYIGATDSNNGITASISNNEYLHPENTISVSYNGSIAEAFYQMKPYWATDDVNVLYPKFALNKYVALFLTTIINKEKYRFNYGRKWDKELMEKSYIKLPVSNDGLPNWTWIEKYVKETILPKLPKKARAVWAGSFDNAPVSPRRIKLHTEQWKWFVINDGTDASLFDVIPGKYHYPYDYSIGNTPYLSATAENNGLGARINLEPEFEGNVLTTEKVKCKAFYQPVAFCATSDVNILRNNSHMNKYVGMFIATVIDFNENFRWTYGRQCRVADTKEIRLKLPAVKTADGKYEPDWQFMEDYIKSLPYSSCL